MLFHEMYSSYFRTVARILSEAGRTPVTEKRMLEIIAENAFSESMLVIPEKLETGEWPLLSARPLETGRPAETGRAGGAGAKTFTSALLHAPARPLSSLEKQWLKALLADPRIRLFLYREEDREAYDRLSGLLQDVPALFAQDVFDYFDRYQDGDDYADAAYVSNFHLVLRAIREERLIGLKYTGHRGITRDKEFIPYGIEYSSKDDKFRVLCRSLHGTPYTINVSRIVECRIGRPAGQEELQLPESGMRHVDLELTDERNALQRAMLHFSDLQKETERIDDMHYKIRLYYRKDDETEIVIRILAFGPMIRVTAPEKFIGLIRDRIIKQERLCGL